jgi:hypothetical protein
MSEATTIGDLVHDRTNPRKHNPRNLKVIVDSLHDVGFARSIVIDENNEILAGNGVTEAAALAGIEKVVEVEADGNTIIAVRRRGLTDEQKQRLKYWDTEQLLADMNAGLDLSTMFSDKELDALLQDIGDDDQESDGSAQEDELSRADVPDALWPTDNVYGVPLLDIRLQAKAFDQPAAIWGVTSRKARMGGTWLFYTEDYRYEALWADPSPILNTGAMAAVEPNFSAYSNMPMAVALWQIYRKRWIARWWQQYGLPVWVDLNVAENHAELNLCGVPDGWRAFATRGYAERIALTHKEYELAQRKAGDNTPLFLVYGGGKAVKAECERMGWLWMQEDMDRAKGREV